MGPVSFLTPIAALVAIAGLVPLRAYVLRERRGRQVRRTLGLADPAQSRALLVALVALPALAGIAAAQPVVDRGAARPERTDVEVFFALDTSRSMLAAVGPDAPTRFDRARTAATAIRARLPELRAGIAQFTDWTVPHLFPTGDGGTFRVTLEKSVDVGSLGSQGQGVVATDVTALAAFARDGYFTPGVRKRLLVVLTDGESGPVGPRLAALRRAGIRTTFVHVWAAGESIWRPEGAEPQYRPDPASGQTLASAAALVEGAVFGEHQLGDVVGRARADAGDGPTRPHERRDLLALMPYVLLAAAAPLGLVLRVRNL